jgi:hypothetical protein
MVIFVIGPFPYLIESMAEATHAKKPVRRPSLRAEANPVLVRAIPIFF